MTKVTIPLGKASFTPRGQWIATPETPYMRLDAVTDSGNAYVSYVDNNASPLTDVTKWMKYAEKGDPFLFDDFTPEQIADLKKPATDAAALANEATLAANTQTGLALEATTAANNAVDLANEVATHPPIIVDDYWHVWNYETNEYEATDKKAKGETGAAALVVQTTGTSETDVMSQKTVTDELALKANQTDLVQLAGEMSELDLKDVVQSNKIKDIENVIITMNPNQSAQLSLSGRKTISLPKNASNGGMQVKLEGLTAKNLVVNGDFRNGTTGWMSATSSSNTVVSGVMVNTGNGTNIEPNAYTDIGAKEVGNKYYATVKVKAKSDTCNRIRIMSVDSFASISNPVIDTTYTMSGIITASTNYRYLVVYHNYASAAESSGKSIEIGDVSCINLTATFGAGNEPDLATCDAMFSDYFEGVKSFVPTGRVRSVDALGLNPTSLYLQSPVLRSNGLVKDEIRKGANGYELVKRVGVGTLGSELIANGNFATDTTWLKQTGWTISGGSANYDATANTVNIRQAITLEVNSFYEVKFTVLSGTARISINTIVGATIGAPPPANYATGSHIVRFKATVINGVAIFGYNANGGTAFSLDNFSVKKIIASDGIISDTSVFTVLGSNIHYTLATPVIIQISYGGILNSAENGTIYHEPVVADAGVYGTNVAILLTDYPISSIEEIIKHEDGVDTYLNASTAVIAPDGLSFTHPDLGSGDLVLFTYAFDKETTNGNITATFYDSNVVKIDTVTGKAYKISDVVTNGVLTRTLTEV